MMAVSKVSRKTTRKTGTEKTFTMVAVQHSVDLRHKN